MLHKNLEYFWADMSIFGGNSGAPVIEADKLVGIVSALATTALAASVAEDDENFHVYGRTPLPFGKMIKAHYIKALLEEQIKKDQRYQQWHSHISLQGNMPQSLGR